MTIRTKQMFAVFTKLARDPEAIFDNHFLAQSYIDLRQKTWTNAQFRIETITNVHFDFITKVCKFCGREFDAEEYDKTMREQTEGKRDDAGKYFPVANYCGINCAWLKDKDMLSSIRRHDGEIHIDAMKEDVAVRVAKYLEKNLHKSSCACKTTLERSKSKTKKHDK